MPVLVIMGDQYGNRNLRAVPPDVRQELSAISIALSPYPGGDRDELYYGRKERCLTAPASNVTSPTTSSPKSNPLDQFVELHGQFERINPDLTKAIARAFTIPSGVLIKQR